MMIQVDETSVAFVMCVQYKGDLDDALKSLKAALDNSGLSGRHTMLSPLEKPDLYEAGMRHMHMMMHRERVTWHYLDKSNCLISTKKKFSKEGQIHRIVRLIQVEKQYLQLMREKVNVAASKREEGSEPQDN